MNMKIGYNKPYSWGEIKEFLIKKLKKTKNIMTFGTVGSCNISHDIDLIITKRPLSKTSNFYKEIHRLFEELDNYLKIKYRANVVCFSHSLEETLLSRLLKNWKKNLLFHTHIYASYPQMDKDWAWAMFEDDNLKEMLIKSYICLIGSVNLIFEEDFMKKKYYSPIFNYLYLYNKINSHYPKKIFIEAMNNYFDYLYRKRLHLNAPIAKNEKEVKKYFYKLCDIVDELEAKREK